VGVGVGVGLGVAVAGSARVGDGVSVGVAVGVAVEVGTGVKVGVVVGVLVVVGVAVEVPVAVAVGVGVGKKKAATWLAPRSTPGPTRTRPEMMPAIKIAATAILRNLAYLFGGHSGNGATFRSLPQAGQT